MLRAPHARKSRARRAPAPPWWVCPPGRSCPSCPVLSSRTLSVSWKARPLAVTVAQLWPHSTSPTVATRWMAIWDVAGFPLETRGWQRMPTDAAPPWQNSNPRLHSYERPGLAGPFASSVELRCDLAREEPHALAGVNMTKAGHPDHGPGRHSVGARGRPRRLSSGAQKRGGTCAV